MELSISSSKRNELIDITSKIQELINIDNGICFIYCPHTTAAITINENADPDVKTDILGHLNSLIPENSNFKHSEGNSDAHIKSSIIGASETIIIKNRKLQLGTWQSIFFCEFDGPRQRKVIIKIMEG